MPFRFKPPDTLTGPSSFGGTLVGGNVVGGTQAQGGMAGLTQPGGLAAARSGWEADAAAGTPHNTAADPMMMDAGGGGGISAAQQATALRNPTSAPSDEPMSLRGSNRARPRLAQLRGGAGAGGGGGTYTQGFTGSDTSYGLI